MKRLLGCAVVMLALPFCISRNTAITNPVPFQSQALAGHTMPNGLVECSCGAADCICDPGETPQSIKATSPQSNTDVSNKGLAGQPNAPVTEGMAMLILAVFFAVLLRMR